jgi:hypothetical protein
MLSRQRALPVLMTAVFTLAGCKEEHEITLGDIQQGAHASASEKLSTILESLLNQPLSTWTREEYGLYSTNIGSNRYVLDNRKRAGSSSAKLILPSSVEIEGQDADSIFDNIHLKALLYERECRNILSQFKEALGKSQIPPNFKLTNCLYSQKDRVTKFTFALFPPSESLATGKPLLIGEVALDSAAYSATIRPNPQDSRVGFYSKEFSFDAAASQFLFRLIKSSNLNTSSIVIEPEK